MIILSNDDNQSISANKILLQVYGCVTIKGTFVAVVLIAKDVE